MTEPIASTSKLDEETPVDANSNGSAQSHAAGPVGTDDNPNMHFDTTAGKWIYENPETGQELEWNIAANAWLPVVDEDVLQAQQAAYKVEGVDDSTPAEVTLARDRRKKRKAGADGDAPNKKAAKVKPPPRNTAVFLQRLPLDATVEEVSKVFSKAGFILPDADGNPKVKLYTDKDTGIRNGDGLVVYLKEESVSLATNLFDDTPFRLGDQDNMKVTKAEWSHKETAENGKAQDAPDERGRKKSDGRAQKMQKRAEKLLHILHKQIDRTDNLFRVYREAADYDPSYDERESPLVAIQASASRAPSINDRVVVLQGIFTLEELAEDSSLLLELKEDIREECESLGTKEADGIVTVKFGDAISAQACVLKNNNRFFGGRQLKAWLYDGKTRYQKSGGTEDAIIAGEDGEAAEKRRLEEFGRWLETDTA
ncbi:hypothetical protein EMMF5_003705 [Cystobasidiomycetes sp. EMM_F5]